MVKKKSTKKKTKKKTMKKVRCAAKTRDGKRCKNFASGRSKYCKAHQKASSRGPKKKKTTKKKKTRKKK